MAKPKVVPIQDERPPQAERSAIVDEFGALEQQLDAFDPVVKRHKQLKEQILSWHEDSPADEVFTEEGSKFSVEISVRAKERTIRSVLKLYKRLGQKIFLSCCTIPLKMLDLHMSKIEQADYISEAQTGSRRVKAIPKLSRAA